MEPFWNEVRIKQVIGRAVRIGSHELLPFEEREVDIFIYVSSRSSVLALSLSTYTYNI